jgi:deazaflavin-dependent oxidoreductase (nitroreductase family)
LIIVTTRGANSGKIRKFGLMRIEKDGEYALVASNGGAARNPGWYHNLVADPTALMIQDGPKRGDFVARLLEGDEYAAWWNRATGVFPPYADYQANTNRTIPIFLASPRA